MRFVAGLLATCVLLPSIPHAAGNDPSKAGAYCPLPEPGQVPQCLAPAKAEFADFFAAVEAGGVDDSESRRLEDALANSATGEEPSGLDDLTHPEDAGGRLGDAGGRPGDTLS